MITTIAKKFTFDAAHFLPTVPPGHKCARMHGHTYEVELVFRGPTSEEGFCRGIDYADITAAWQKIHDVIDHRVLNEITGLAVPSTEHLAAWVIARLRPDFPFALHSVRISESSTTWCEALVKDVP